MSEAIKSEATQNQNRYKLLVVSPELLFALFQKGVHQNAYEVVSSEVPVNARFVNVRHGWENHIEILIESPDFEPLKAGDQVPVLMPLLRDMRVVEQVPDGIKPGAIVVTDADREQFDINIKKSASEGTGSYAIQ